METIEREVGEAPSVHVLSIGGDLRLMGQEGTALQVQSPDGGKLKVAEEGGEVRISSRYGCLVFLPAGSRVTVDTVGGDLRVTGVVGELGVTTVGGDLSLRRVGSARIERVGGDLDARKVAGDVEVSVCGGDGSVDRVEGDVRLSSLGGDVLLNRITGEIDVNLGGDANLRLLPPISAGVRINAGGDLAVRLPEGVSARVQVVAGGDVRSSGLPEATMENGSLVVEMGEGGAEVELLCGGDAWLDGGEVGAGDVDLDFGGEIASQVGAKMAEMEARLSVLGPEFSAFDAERIGERVRRSVARAMRRSAHAKKRAWHAEKTKLHAPGPGVWTSGGGRGGVDEEERLTILRMLEKGTINTDEAEALLKALEE